MSRIAALVLAAGRSTRFDAGATTTKAVAALSGKPLVRWVAEAALASQARPVIVVTGHAAEPVSAALKGLDVQFTHSADYAGGLSHSLRAGLSTTPRDADGAIILLADMPLISASLIDHLIDVFQEHPEASAVVPVFRRRRGNPVLISRQIFPAVAKIEGDHGAGPLLAEIKHVVEWPVSSDSIHIDIDKAEELHRLDAANAQQISSL